MLAPTPAAPYPTDVAKEYSERLEERAAEEESRGSGYMAGELRKEAEIARTVEARERYLASSTAERPAQPPAQTSKWLLVAGWCIVTYFYFFGGRWF